MLNISHRNILENPEVTVSHLIKSSEYYNKIYFAIGQDTKRAKAHRSWLPWY